MCSCVNAEFCPSSEKSYFSFFSGMCIVFIIWKMGFKKKIKLRPLYSHACLVCVEIQAQSCC